MARSDLIAMIILGGITGLLCFVLAYGHTVWRIRSAKAPGSGPGPGDGETRPSRWLSAVTLVCAVLAVVALARAATSRNVTHLSGVLASDDIFTVKPRLGLVPVFVAPGPLVQKGDVLARFHGAEGEGAQIAVATRRAVLKNEREVERARSLEFAPDLTRRMQAAEQAYRLLADQEKLLLSERDALNRESTQQRSGLVTRRFRIDDAQREIDGELEQKTASLATERFARNQMQQLFERGAYSRLEVMRKEESVAILEGRIAELQDRRALLGSEKQDLLTLRSDTNDMFASQIGARNRSLAELEAPLATAVRERELALAGIELDRPRAQALRERKLLAIDEQIDECDAVLGGPTRQWVVVAPWDGRIGYRQASLQSGSANEDKEPILVEHRAGGVWVGVRVEPSTAASVAAAVSTTFQLVAAKEGSSTFSGGAPLRLPAANGLVELRIPCDPPEGIIRQLGTEGALPVHAHLTMPLRATPTFLAALVLAGMALVAAVGRVLVRRRHLESTAPLASVIPFVDPSAPVDSDLHRLAGPAAQTSAPTTSESHLPGATPDDSSVLCALGSPVSDETPQTPEVLEAPIRDERAPQ